MYNKCVIYHPSDDNVSYFFAFVGLSYSSDVNGFKFGACSVFLVTSGVLFKGVINGFTSGGK